MRAPRLKIQRYTHSSTSKWVVDGWKENGKRKRVFFRTRADAETWAHCKTVEAENFGTRAIAAPEELRLEAVKCSDKLKPFNKSLTDAVNYYVDHLRSVAQSCTVTPLIAEFLVSRTSKGRSPKYVKDLRNRLRRFEAAFGEQNAATITTREIDQWISGLDLGPQSQNNRYVSSILRHPV